MTESVPIRIAVLTQSATVAVTSLVNSLQGLGHEVTVTTDQGHDFSPYDLVVGDRFSTTSVRFSAAAVLRALDKPVLVVIGQPGGGSGMGSTLGNYMRLLDLIAGSNWSNPSVEVVAEHDITAGYNLSFIAPVVSGTQYNWAIRSDRPNVGTPILHGSGHFYVNNEPVLSLVEEGTPDLDGVPVPQRRALVGFVPAHNNAFTLTEDGLVFLQRTVSWLVPDAEPPVEEPSAPAAISSPAGGERVSASISVSWLPAVDPQGLPLQYEGEYWDGVEWAPLFSVSGLQYEWDTSELPEGDYRVRVQANNGSAVGPYVESESFSVDHLGVPGPFVAPLPGVYFYEVGVEWGAADPIEGEPLTYELQYAKDGGEWLPLTQTEDTSFPLVLSDLEGSGEYQLRVRALSGEHESAWVESVAFTLRSNVAPPTPEIITPEAGGRLGDTTRIEWDPVFDEDGDPVLYEGDYWDGSAWVPLFPMQEETSFEWDTSALAPRGGYRIRVRAFDGLLYSGYAEVANLRVPGFAPCLIVPAGSFEDVRPPFVYDRTSTYGDYVLTLNPLLYWRFEERTIGETGVPIRDHSGNERHAVWDGQPSQIGVPGAVCIRGARPGSGARVIGPPAGPWILDPWAAYYGRHVFTAWVRFDDVVVRNVIASWPGTWTFYVEDSRFWLAQSHGGSTYPDVPYGPGVNLISQQVSHPLVEPDTWYFVMAYMDRGSARGFYVNGQSWGGSVGPGGSSSPPSNQPIQIGDSNGFRGVIDEVALFAFSTNESPTSQVNPTAMMNMGLAAVCTEGGSFVPCEVPAGSFEPCDDDGGGGVPI